MVGQALQTTPRYGITITTVDPAQGLIRGVMKGDATERGILVVEVPNAFRWPQVGESWMVCQKNGTWYLEGFYPSQTTPITIQGINPGDLVLSSPTGVVHIMGSADGASDFILTRGIVSPPREPTLDFGGTLKIVLNHGRATSSLSVVTL